MKKILVLLLFATMPAWSQYQISKPATIPVSLYYYAQPQIIFSTPTVAQVMGRLQKPDGTENTFALLVAGYPSLVSGTKSGSVGVKMAGAYLDQVGAYNLILNASFCLQNIPNKFTVYATDAFYQNLYGNRAQIAAVTASVTENHVSTRSMVGAWATDATALIIASGDLIPNTGGTMPSYLNIFNGDNPRTPNYIIFRSLSYSTDEPEFLLAFREDNGSETTPIMEASLTHNYTAMHGTVLGATPYEHYWSLDVSNLAKNRRYGIVIAFEKEGHTISREGSALIQNPTLTISLDEPLVTSASFSSFISDISQAFRETNKGMAEMAVYRNTDALSRAIPGTSSYASRGLAAGSIYAVTKLYIDPFSDENVYYNWFMDQDENYGVDGLAKTYYSTDSVAARAALDAVTITTAGGN